MGMQQRHFLKSETRAPYCTVKKMNKINKHLCYYITMSSYIIINYSCFESKRSGAMELVSVFIVEQGIKEAKELHGAVAPPG